MSKDTEHTNNSQANNVDNKNVIDETADYDYKAEDKQEGDIDSSETDTTENLEDKDFSEGISDEDKASIKEVASDDNLSAPKSYASILVEQVIDAKETFNRSLGSLFEGIPNSV